VAVGDSGSAGELIRMLVERFDAGDVSFDAERRHVCIENSGSNRALLRALDVVEEWVTLHVGVPTTVELDGRPYTLGPAASIGGVG
jgi:hypothetical protein